MTAPASAPAEPVERRDRDLLQTFVEERAEHLDHDDHEQEHRHERPGVCLLVVRMDQRRDRVAEVRRGEAR